MTPKLRKRYEVAYPGYETLTQNIIPSNLDKASNGDVQMQASVAWQYFKTLGYSRPPGWIWSRFEITDTGQPGRPPQHSRESATTKPASLAVTGSCCDYDNCTVCDIGNHHYCRRGCTLEVKSTTRKPR